MAHPEAKYPFITSTNGFDLELLLNTSRRDKIRTSIITTESGRQLTYSLGGYQEEGTQFYTIDFADLIAINEAQRYRMRASYFHNSQGLGIVEFDILTRIIDLEGDTNIPHPDMFASQFIGSVISFLDQEEMHISALRGKWYNWSLNRIQMTKCLKTGNTLDEAIAATWSSQAFCRWGFSQIVGYNYENEQERNSYFEVYFKRPAI
ncbi:MAG: hypothetical protein ACEQSA_01555 [Weeksellaceae bacterium]